MTTPQQTEKWGQSRLFKFGDATMNFSVTIGADESTFVSLLFKLLPRTRKTSH